MLNKNILEEAVLELRTLRDMLRWAMTQFYAEDIYFGHGTDNAWDEAVSLALYALHLPPEVNPQIVDAALTNTERRKIAKLIFRRVTERLPAAYLTNEAWFAGLKFFIDQRVLIPRSPLAELIEHHFSPWIQPEQVENIMDLCTGSGCIAIACAKAFPDARIDAIDISVDALTVAQQNIETHQITEQVHLLQSDLFAAVAPKKYDIIISNPPYVDAQDMAKLPKEYLHEPALGLAAGENGLAVVERILRDAAHYLSEQGILIVEVGNSEAALIERYPQVPFTWLEFQRGDGGVFLLTTAQLQNHQALFKGN